MSQEEKDKKNKQAGILISVGSHIAIILLFIFLVAWRAPNPPLPEFGIELNFGTSDQGTGDTQPETTPAEAEEEEDALPDTPEEVAEEQLEETTENVEEIAEPTEAIEDEIIPVTEQETEDPVEASEEVTPKEVVVEKKEDPKPPKVLYPGKKDGAAGTEGDSKTAADANQGDKTDAEGDQGDKDGSVDARALYGKQGGGGGGSMLEMAGWMWDDEPDPEESTDQSGKIVFEVLIDDIGNVTSVKAISYTVSASLVRVYQAEVERLTFSKTSTGPAPPSSKGKITFVIKAK
jgi:outer membrane biosynthesis protein TonB